MGIKFDGQYERKFISKQIDSVLTLSQMWMKLPLIRKANTAKPLEKCCPNTLLNNGEEGKAAT